MKTKELQAKERKNAMNKWIAYNEDKTKTKLTIEEIDAFETGFNMGWKRRPAKILLEGEIVIRHIKGILKKKEQK